MRGNIEIYINKANFQLKSFFLNKEEKNTINTNLGEEL